MPCQRPGWRRYTWPDSPIWARTCSTHTAPPSATRCGSCTPMRCDDAESSRHWSNGIRTFPASTGYVQKPNTRAASRRLYMETTCGRTPRLRELQQWMAALIVSGEPLAALLRNGGACEALIARGRGNIAERLAV